MGNQIGLGRQPSRIRRNLANSFQNDTVRIVDGEAALSPKLSDAASNLLAKVEAVIPDRLRACMVETTLWAPNDHFAEPLTVYGPVWLLTARCALRVDFRCFRLDCMSDMVMLEDAFRPEPGKTIQDYLRQDATRRECSRASG